jgi:hypothetical protein
MVFEERVFRAIARFPDRGISDAEFNDLALLTYARQRLANPVYRRFCGRAGALARLSRWTDIPALPVSAFKAAAVASFGPREAARTFLTSGTTRGVRRGRHLFATLAFYDAVIDRLARRHLVPDRRRIAVANLITPPEEKPESSLSHMAARIRRTLGTDGSFQLRGGPERFGDAVRFLRARSRSGSPVLVLSTTLGLAAFLDRLERDGALALPRGSRVMETGGSKGARTAVSRAELLARAARLLGVGPRRVVNEYGMTELTSHFYDRAPGGVKSVPPWTRVRVIDPATGREAPRGRPGLLRIVDLANQGSCAAVQTEDEGVAEPGGFRVLGRRPGADLRGCSLGFEEMLEEARA